jgi:GGDEF domain-containing protein
MNKEITRADRQRTGLAVIAIRLPATWQKLNNNEYENRIASAGHRLQSTIREFDTCYRLTNDDFVVMLPNSTQEDGEVLQEDLLKAINKSRYAKPHLFLIKITTYEPEDDSYSLLKRAIAKLEESK